MHAVLEDLDGTETPLGHEIEVLLVDFSSDVVSHLQEFDPAADAAGIQCFYLVSSSAEIGSSLHASSEFFITQQGKRYLRRPLLSRFLRKQIPREPNQRGRLQRPWASNWKVSLLCSLP